MVLDTRSRLRILIIDDNRDSADSLAMMAQLLTGCETRTAFDGRQAVAVAEEYLPDLMFVDLGLPILSGIDVVRRCREQAWGKEIVMVAATCWGRPEDRRRSIEAGFNHHCVKPIDPDILVDLIFSLQAANMSASTI